MAVINSSLDCLDWTDIGQRIESGVSVRSEDTEDTRGRGLAAVWPMGTLGCRGSVSVDTRQWSPSTGPTIIIGADFLLKGGTYCNSQ